MMPLGNSGMDPKAQKRFNNDRVRAAQANLQGQAAKSSLRTNVRRGVAPQPNQAPMVQASPQGNLNVPTGAPQMQAPMPQVPPMMPPENPNDIAMGLENDLNLDKLLSSPELQQSLAKSRLRQYFKRNNPSGADFNVAEDALANFLQ